MRVLSVLLSTGAVVVTGLSTSGPPPQIQTYSIADIDREELLSLLAPPPAAEYHASTIEDTIWSGAKKFAQHVIGGTSKFVGQFWVKHGKATERVVEILKDINELYEEVERTPSLQEDFKVVLDGLSVLVDSFDDLVEKQAELREVLASAPSTDLERINMELKTQEEEFKHQVFHLTASFTSVLEKSSVDKKIRKRMMSNLGHLERFSNGFLVTTAPEVINDISDIFEELVDILTIISEDKKVLEIVDTVKDDFFAITNDAVFEAALDKLADEVFDAVVVLYEETMDDPVLHPKFEALERHMDKLDGKITKGATILHQKAKKMGTDLILEAFKIVTNTDAQDTIASLLKQITHMVYLGGTGHLRESSDLGAHILTNMTTLISEVQDPVVKKSLVVVRDHARELVRHTSVFSETIMSGIQSCSAELREIGYALEAGLDTEDKALAQSRRQIALSVVKLQRAFASLKETLSTEHLRRQDAALESLFNNAISMAYTIDAIKYRDGTLANRLEAFEERVTSTFEKHGKALGFRGGFVSHPTYNGIEEPAAEKVDIYGVLRKVYSPEQQKRLQINEDGLYLEDAELLKTLYPDLTDSYKVMGKELARSLVALEKEDAWEREDAKLRKMEANRVSPVLAQEIHSAPPGIAVTPPSTFETVELYVAVFACSCVLAGLLYGLKQKWAQRKYQSIPN